MSAQSHQFRNYQSSDTLNHHFASIPASEKETHQNLWRQEMEDNLAENGNDSDDDGDNFDNSGEENEENSNEYNSSGRNRLLMDGNDLLEIARNFSKKVSQNDNEDHSDHSYPDRNERNDHPDSKDSRYSYGRWTSHEHALFLEGIQMFDNKWQLISNHIKTRNTIQVRTHAQKFYLKMNKQMHHMTGHTGSISVPPQFTEMKQYKQTTRVNQTPAQTAHFPLPRQKQPNYDDKREYNPPVPSKTSQSNSSSSKLSPGIPSQPSTATPAHPSTAVGLTLPQDLLQNYIANIDAQIQQNKQEKFAAYAASNRDKSFNDNSSKVNRKPPTNVGPYFQHSQQQQHQIQQQYMDKFPPFLHAQMAQNGVNYSQQPQGMLGVSGTNYTYWQPPAPQNNQFNANIAAHNNPNISNSNNNYNGLNFSQNNIHFTGQNMNNSNSNSGNYVSNNDTANMNSNKNKWSSMYSTMDNHNINFNNNQFSFPSSDPNRHNNLKQMENYNPMQQYGPPFPHANQSNSQSLLPFVPTTSNTSNTSTNTTSSGINSFPNNMLTVPFDGMNNSVVAQPLPPITAAMMLPGIPASQSTQSTQFSQSQSTEPESAAQMGGSVQAADKIKPTAPWASAASSDNHVNTSAGLAPQLTALSAPLPAAQPTTASQDSVSPPKVIHFQHGLTLVSSSENETASSDAPLLTSLGKLSENRTDLLSSSVALLSKTALSPQAHNTRLSGLMFPLSDGNHAQEQHHQQASQNLFSPPAPVEVQYTTEEIKAMQSIGGVNGLINTMRIQQMHLNGGNLNGVNLNSSNGALLSQLQLQQPPPQPSQPKKRGRPLLYNTSSQPAQSSSLEAQQREKLAKLTPLTGFVGAPMPEDSFVRVPSIELPVPQVSLLDSSEFNESVPPSQQHQAQLMNQQALQIAAKQQVDQMNAALQQLQKQQSTQHFFADHSSQQEFQSSLIAPTPLPLIAAQSTPRHFEQESSDSDHQQLRQQQQYPEQQLNFDIAQQLAQLQAHLENVNKPPRRTSAARAGVSGSEFSNHSMAQLHEALRTQPEQLQRHQKIESDISGILNAFSAAKNTSNGNGSSGSTSPIPPSHLQQNNNVGNTSKIAGFGKEVRSGYRHLNLAQKYEVVQKMKQFEASPVKVKGTQGLLAIEFNVCQSSIYQILKKRDEIEKEYLAELHRQNNDCSFPPAEMNYGNGYNAKQLGYDHMLISGSEGGLFNTSSSNINNRNSSNGNSGPTQDGYASGQTTQEQLSQMSWQQQLLSQEDGVQQYGEEYGEEYGDDNGDSSDNSDNGAMDTQESSGSGQQYNNSNSRSSNSNRNRSSSINNNITSDNRNNDNRNNKHGFNQYYTSDQHAALDEVPKPGSIGAAALSAHSVELFVDTTAVIPAIPMSRYLQEEPESPVKRVPLRTSQSATAVSREQRQRKPSAKVKENYNSTSSSTAATTAGTAAVATYSTARLAEYYTMMAKFELIVAEQLNVYNIQTVTDAHKYVEWYAQYYELTELNGDPWHYTPEWFATFNEQYMEGRFVIDYC